MDRENATLLQRQAMNRSSFYMLLFLFSLLFLNFSDEEASRRGRPTIDGLLESLEQEMELLGNVTFGVNITHPIPPEVETQLRTLDHVAGSNAHYYHNITGVFRGDWKSQNVTVLPDDDTNNNRTSQDEARGNFQFDGDGSFTLNIKSMGTRDENVHYVEGYMRLKDAEKSDYGALLLAEGVHFLDKGSLYLIGVPDGAMYQSEELLHMLPDNQSMIQTRNVLFEQFDKRMDELKELASSGGQYVDDHEQPLSVDYSCTFQIFAQLHPVPKDIKLVQLLEYEKEQELENPQGISTIKPPPLSMASVMYSPNCGLSLSYDNAQGTKIEKYYGKAVSYAAMACVLAIIQIFSLINQMEYTPTPSSISNVSYWTIAMQAMMDGYLCLLHLTTGVVIETVFLPFAAAAFFSFILVSVFSMRYLLVVWRIQRPESSRSGASTAANQQEQRSILPTTNTPRPAAAATATTGDTPRDIGVLYYRLYALLLIGLFIFYQTSTRSAFVQNVIIGGLGFAFYSFWIPQIVRNVLRGCRRPLSRRYILGMSITRLAIPLYFYGCPHNLIAHEQSSWVWVLVGYVALQVLILTLQDRLGPRFFVPEKYLPQTYNYHPILSRDDEETGQSHPRDCAICMLPVDTSNTGPPGLNMLNRAQYMLTPCQHLFHTDCLEQWMRIKLECPVCRSYLPAC